MTTVDQILTELRGGVDDQTWAAHVADLHAQGAQVVDGVATADGGRSAEVRFGWPSAHHIERDSVGHWYLIAPLPGTMPQP